MPPEQLGGRCRSPSPWPLGCSEPSREGSGGSRPGLCPGVPLPCDEVPFVKPAGDQGAAAHPAPQAGFPPPCPGSLCCRPPPALPRSQALAGTRHSLACLQPSATVPWCSRARLINDSGQVRFSAGVAPHASTAVSPTKRGLPPLPTEFRVWGAEESGTAAWGERGKCGKRIPFLCSRGA